MSILERSCDKARLNMGVGTIMGPYMRSSFVPFQPSSAMTRISSDALMSIAKGHLGLPLSTSVRLSSLMCAGEDVNLTCPSQQDARVPQFYVDELRRHLVLYPAEHSVSRRSQFVHLYFLTASLLR
jgi:hypothetical protein